MTAPAPQKAGPFAATHSAFEQRVEGTAPAWLTALRRDAIKRFLDRGLPTRRDEEWKYTSLRPLEGRAFEVPTGFSVFDATRLSAHVDPADVTLVFVDGVLATAYSRMGELPEGVTVQALADAAKERKEDLLRLFTPEEPGAAVNPFADLNTAFLQSGVLVEVAPKTALARTIHLIYAASEKSGAEEKEGLAPAAFPRNVLLLGELAEATVVETYLGASDAREGQPTSAYFVSPATDVRLARGARLRHVKIVADGPDAVHVGLTRAEVERDASFESFVHCQGGRLTRSDLDVVLAGPGANATIDGLYLAKGEQHVDNHTTVDHRVPDATSAQLYKGILDGKARAVFNGKVCVRQDAQRTSARQLNKNLLLSSDAEIDTKPELQIDADDVKCSHGAAIGQLDEGEIFYLMSRGIDRGRAVSMLSQAYADEALLRLQAGPVRERLRRMTMEWFAR